MNTSEDLWEDPQHVSIQESRNEFSTSFSNLSSSCESTSYLQHLETPSFSPRCEDPKTTKLVLLYPSQINGSYVKFISDQEGESTSAAIIGNEEKVIGHISHVVYWVYLTTTFSGALAIILILIQLVW
jgi:hypothetical protein